MGDKGAYLGAVIDALSPDVPPVLVSPSMSGSFVVPFLADTPEKVDDPPSICLTTLFAFFCAGIRLGPYCACFNLSGSCLFSVPFSAHDDSLRGAGPQPRFLFGQRPQAHPNLNCASSIARGEAPRLPGPARPLAQIAHQLQQADLDLLANSCVLL